MKAAKRVFGILQSKRMGLIIFAALSAGTIGLAAAAASSAPGRPAQPAPFITAAPAAAPAPASAQRNGLVLSAALSEAKLVQGSDGQVFVDISIAAPAGPAQEPARRPSDMIVVLDRSGSMAEARKMAYAKSAVSRLLQLLGPEDRFALIAFDSDSRVYVPLGFVTEGFRRHAGETLDAIVPGSSTNISVGLEQAKETLRSSAADRPRKILLLSDGLVNTGIVDPAALNELALSLTAHGAVLSSIGMGLDFDERLLLALADHGGGDYSYLETLENLGTLFAGQLSETRNIYAHASSIRLDLPPGSRLVRAAGYPISYPQSAAQALITTGQLLAGRKKNVLLTISLPAGNVGEYDLGHLEFTCRRADGDERLTLEGKLLTVAVIPPERGSEALASLNHQLLDRIWQKNLYGLVKQQNSSYIAANNQSAAKQVIAEFNDSLLLAEKKYGKSLYTPELKQGLKEMEDKIDYSFAASGAERERRQKSTAKDFFSLGSYSERAY